jgi:hypothetical protein
MAATVRCVMAADDRTDLDATRRTVAALLPTIDGIEAEGYLSDLLDLLRSVQGVLRVDASKTADPLRRFEVTCRFTGKPRAVARRVETAWTRRLAYRPDAAHRVEVAGDEGFTLEFVTWLPQRWHVTGRVVARH